MRWAASIIFVVVLVWHNSMTSDALTLLLWQPVRSVSDVAQSEQTQIRFGHLLKTVWTVSTRNRIWVGIRFESDSPAVWTQPNYLRGPHCHCTKGLGAGPVFLSVFCIFYFLFIFAFLGQGFILVFFFFASLHFFWGICIFRMFILLFFLFIFCIFVGVLRFFLSGFLCAFF